MTGKANRDFELQTSSRTLPLCVEADLNMKRQALEVPVPRKSKENAKRQEDPLIRISENLELFGVAKTFA